jgi:hypothetical protein
MVDVVICLVIRKLLSCVNKLKLYVKISFHLTDHVVAADRSNTSYVGVFI